MPRTVSHLVHFFTTAAVNFGTLFWVKCYILCMTVMVCVMSIGFLNRKDGDSQCLHMLMIVLCCCCCYRTAGATVLVQELSFGYVSGALSVFIPPTFLGIQMGIFSKKCTSNISNSTLLANLIKCYAFSSPGQTGIYKAK